jgi:hypothetical protein
MKGESAAAREQQGYIAFPIRAEPPMCGNCKQYAAPTKRGGKSYCSFGEFQVKFKAVCDHHQGAGK